MKRARVAVLAVALLPVGGAARADVVGPPIVKCKPNERAEPSHGGGICVPTRCPPGQVIGQRVGGGVPACLGPAPKSCPVGWVGVDGPNCVLAVCDDDTGCKDGLACREVPVCTRDSEGYVQNDADRASRGLFAAPPPYRKKREYVRGCDASLACDGTDTCRSVRVCLPAGAASVGPKPTNAAASLRYGSVGSTWNEKALGSADAGAPVVAPPASASAASTPPSATPPGDPTSAPPPAKPDPVPPRSGRGSAGCSAGGGGEGSLALVALALALGVARSRRRAKDR